MFGPDLLSLRPGIHIPDGLESHRVGVRYTQHLQRHRGLTVVKAIQGVQLLLSKQLIQETERAVGAIPSSEPVCSASSLGRTSAQQANDSGMSRSYPTCRLL